MLQDLRKRVSHLAKPSILISLLLYFIIYYDHINDTLGGDILLAMLIFFIRSINST